MATYDDILAPLDRKCGRPVTTKDWKLASQKARTTPELVTDDELTIIRAFAGDNQAEAVAVRRAKALGTPEALPAPLAAQNTAGTRRVVTLDLLHRILNAEAEGLAAAVVDVIKAALAPALERIAALETTPYLKYCGVYECGRAYQPGEAVTRSGSLWICKAATMGAPGQDFIGWQLAVKRGPDAKDGK